jgi:hypothetical protein
LAWETADQPILKDIKSAMKKCKDQGIWALLWDQKVRDKGEKDVGARKDGNEEEEEEEEEEKNVVSERGWEVLEWLLSFWKKDQELHPELGEFPIFFLSQDYKWSRW